MPSEYRFVPPAGLTPDELAAWRDSQLERLNQELTRRVAVPDDSPILAVSPLAPISDAEMYPARTLAYDDSLHEELVAAIRAYLSDWVLRSNMLEFPTNAALAQDCFYALCGYESLPPQPYRNWLQAVGMAIRELVVSQARKTLELQARDKQRSLDREEKSVNPYGRELLASDETTLSYGGSTPTAVESGGTTIGVAVSSPQLALSRDLALRDLLESQPQLATLYIMADFAGATPDDLSGLYVDDPDPCAPKEASIVERYLGLACELVRQRDGIARLTDQTTPRGADGSTGHQQ